MDTKALMEKPEQPEEPDPPDVPAHKDPMPD
jgi:hypothetical protein